MKAVIFDMDGVIVDTMNLHHEATVKTFSEHGLGVDEKELKKFDSMRSSEAYRHFFSSRSEGEIEKMIAKKYAWLTRQTSGIKPIPGFIELLYRLKGKYPLAICSSSQKHFIEHILKEIGEKKSFKVIVGAEMVSKGKPDPEGYLMAAKLLGVPPFECVVIEDSLFGVASAKAAGMKCIAVTNTYDRNFLLDADMIVDNLSELAIGKMEGLF